MIPRLFSLVLLGLLALLSACEMQVATDYNTTTSFNALRSFSWVARVPAPNEDPRLYNDLMDQRMQRIITTELIARGYTRAGDKAPADFLVTYHLVPEQETSNPTVGFGYGFGFGGPGSAVMMGGTTQPRSYDQTQVMIDILDGKTRSLLWRGSVRQPELDDSNPAAIDAEVGKIVRAILAKFPPL